MFGNDSGGASQSTTANSDYPELIRRLDARGLSFRAMKRCFMTGKQCIFSHVLEGDRVEAQLADSGRPGLAAPGLGGRRTATKDFKVFVVMPFAPNLETFYRWSLKPYLISGYHLLEKNIQRADEVRDIGYIVCEKICRRIQESDLVLAEISLLNPNVFYEIGLAYGLERPIVFLRDVNADDILLDWVIATSLNLKPEARVLKYPGVGMLKTMDPGHRLEDHLVQPPSPQKVSRALKISVLNVQHATQASRNGVAAPKHRPDIGLAFDGVVSGAIGVAMSEIRADVLDDKNTRADEPWVEVVRRIDNETWAAFAGANPIRVDAAGQFEAIAREIESSFCTVIDVSGSDPVAYFWLGYCHARGLNAIPVYRHGSSRIETGVPASEEEDNRLEIDIPSGRIRVPPTSAAEQVSRLAFDIHALWFAEYDPEKPYDFKTKMREILEHLLQRDLPDRQKRAFWDRFPAESKLKVFTGAIHDHRLNREMVGDWDVRTVSELFSYLPSVREAMALELVRPLYSPEEAFRRTAVGRRTSSREEFIRDYCADIERQLEHSSAIVIASADVNPVTEYLLYRIYDVKRSQADIDIGRGPFEECESEPEFSGYIVLKRLPGVAEEAPKDGFSRMFYKEEKCDGPSARGFALHNRNVKVKDLVLPYASQDECHAKFSLLGHLVVAHHPQGAGNLVVLLNGVSGPATFALAQILTGGGRYGTRGMNSESERMLAEINRILDTQDCIGVEVIVWVDVRPAERPLGPIYVDSRQVESWSFHLEPEDNPAALRRRHLEQGRARRAPQP